MRRHTLRIFLKSLILNDFQDENVDFDAQTRRHRLEIVRNAGKTLKINDFRTDSGPKSNSGPLMSAMKLICQNFLFCLYQMESVDQIGIQMQVSKHDLTFVKKNEWHQENVFSFLF